jgi:hypothetical protein
MNFLSLRFAKNLIIAGIIVIAISLILLLPFRNYFSAEPVDNELIGQFGDFIGGIAGSFWALAGVIMFYVALHEQRKDFETNREILSAQLDEFKLQQLELAETREVFKEQSETLRIQRFENSFFSMVNSFNDLVKSFSIKALPRYESQEQEYFGRKALIIIDHLVSEKFIKKLNNMDNIRVLESYFDQFANREFNDYETITTPLIKMIEQIIFLIFDSKLDKERKRYVDILKSHLDQSQFAVIGYMLISNSSQYQELLMKIKVLHFYDHESFRKMKNVNKADALLREKINNASWSLN